MAESRTVEVDADELSDEVIEDLVDEGGLSKAEAEEIGDDVWLEEVDVIDPDKRTWRWFASKWYSDIISYSERARSWISGFSMDSGRTTRAKIISVGRSSSDGVELEFKHPNRGSRTVCLGTDSKTLANLMAYHGVSNPAELEGNLVQLSSGKGSYNRLSIDVPDNVSALGRMRFKLYSLAREVREMTEFRRISDDPDAYMDLLMIGTVIAGLLSMVGVMIEGLGSSLIATVIYVPVILFALFGGSLILYGLCRFAMFVVVGLLEGDFKEL